MELRRTKNAATIIAFPIMKNDGTLISGATGLDSEIDQWSDGAAPDGFADCANEATEIGSTGQYYLSLTQSEMNADYIIVQIKSTSSGAITQTLLINTTPQRADLINIAGAAVATSSAQLGVNVVNWKGSAAPNNTGDAYAVVSHATYGNSAIKTETAAIKTKTDGLNFTGTDVKATLDGETVTVATNNDKTGYALATAPPSAADIKTAIEAAGSHLALIKAKTDNLPASPAAVGSAMTLTGAYDAAKTAASQSSVDAIDDYVDTEVAAIKSVTDKLNTALELDGAVYRLTENALEQAPTASGGDATAANQTAIIAHLTDVKGTGFVKDSHSLVNLVPGASVNVTVEHTNITEEHG